MLKHIGYSDLTKKYYFLSGSKGQKVDITEDIEQIIKYNSDPEYLKEINEIERCKTSPYYFATKYLQINGKPFTTHLNEKDFNEYFNEVCRLNNKL